MFTVPAIYSAQIGYDGTTVVIVPIILLRQDQQRRIDGFRSMGITCIEWNKNRPRTIATVVLVTPESFITTKFGDFIGYLKSK